MNGTTIYDDPRPILLLSIVCGVVVWWSSPLYLCIISLCLLSILFLPSLPQSVYKKTTIYYHAIFFICSWCVIKFVVDSFTIPMPLYEALANTALLALRLCILTFLGLLLISKTTTRNIALAAGWYLRPFFKQHSWEIALALTLMLHTIPRLFHTISQVRITTRHRLSHLSNYKQIQIIMSTITRILIVSITKQTIAIIAKRLAFPEAWELKQSPVKYHIVIAIIISCILIYFSILS